MSGPAICRPTGQLSHSVLESSAGEDHASAADSPRRGLPRRCRLALLGPVPGRATAALRPRLAAPLVPYETRGLARQRAELLRADLDVLRLIGQLGTRSRRR